MPLYWLVNDRSLKVAPWRREAFWSLDGEGLVRITALDQVGQSASTGVWINRGKENRFYSKPV